MEKLTNCPNLFANVPYFENMAKCFDNVLNKQNVCLKSRRELQKYVTTFKRILFSVHLMSFIICANAIYITCFCSIQTSFDILFDIDVSLRDEYLKKYPQLKNSFSAIKQFCSVIFFSLNNLNIAA